MSRLKKMPDVLREQLMPLEQIDFFPTAVRAETTASRLALEGARLASSTR